MSETKVPETLVGPLLQSFFVEHLCNQKRLSPQTVKSYLDTFRLLLQYLQATMAKKPSTLSIADLDAPVILSFLESLEQQRYNQAQSRNVRLTAIRSFFRLVAIRDPASVGVATRVLAIPLKRIDQHLVGYLTRPEVDAILAANNLTAWNGRRDHALLLSLYNTGARVSEIISLRRSHFSFGVKSFVQFKGKGNTHIKRDQSNRRFGYLTRSGNKGYLSFCGTAWFAATSFREITWYGSGFGYRLKLIASARISPHKS
jgi:Site-specific recombinase XerD